MLLVIWFSAELYNQFLVVFITVAHQVLIVSNVTPTRTALTWALEESARIMLA